MNRHRHIVIATGVLLTAALTIAPLTDAVADNCLIYPENTKKYVYLEFNDRPMVRDTHIRQKGCDLTLAIVVDRAVNEAYAQELGDNFVRFTKALGPGPGPSRQIGKGIYNYLIGVFTPDKKQIALGAKDASARSIYW